MQETTNFRLKKQELSDPADITQISSNWDKIDAEMSTVNGKTGGTIEGDVTVTGSLSLANPIRSTNAEFLQSQVDVTKGVAPAETKYSHISMFDKNGYNVANNRLAHVDYSVNPDGTATLYLSVNKFEQASGETPASLFVRYQADGTPRFFLSHDPKKDSNSQDIATTSWVRSLTATAAEYGLVKLADENDAPADADPSAAVSVPLLYELANYRRINTAYNAGDRVACAFHFEYYLECIQAGTTSGDALDTRNVTVDQEIEDGAAKWIVRKRIFQINGQYPDADGNVEVSGGGSGDNDTVVLKPIPSAPVNNDTNLSLTPTLTAGDFATIVVGEQRKYREFQLTSANSPNWNSPIFTTQVNTNSCTVSPALEVDTKYLWRCRDVSQHDIKSAWSDTWAFTTREAVTVAQPVVSVTGGTTDVRETPTFTTSAFATEPSEWEDTHKSTSWYLLDASNDTEIWKSENDTSNLTSLTLAADILEPGESYKMRVVHTGQQYGNSAAGEVQFTTALKFTYIATPTLTCSEGTSGVKETPTITGSAFTVLPEGSDSHTWTTWEVLQNGNTSVYRLEQSASALTTLNIPSGVLKVSQSYTVTCIYNGATYGQSARGEITFTTADVFTGPKAPVLTISPSAEAFLATGTIKAAGEYVDGDYEPDKAEWEIMSGAGGEAIWQSGEVTGAKVEACWAPFGETRLSANTAYKIRCRQHYADNEQGGTWSSWSELNFTTSQDYNKIPAWGRIYFKVGPGGGDLKTSYFRWYDASVIHVTVNGEENTNTVITLNENDLVAIYNSDRNSTPDLWFKPLNPVEILEPLPLLTLNTDGSKAVTDFGGDVGVENVGSNRNTDTDKYGLFAQCENLTTLCDGLFRNNPQVYCLGAMGGGGGGGGGGMTATEIDNIKGGDGGGSNGISGTGSDRSNDGGNGANGWGCFAQNSKLTNVPENLFYYFNNKENTIFFGGYGGGGGGGGGDGSGSGEGCGGSGGNGLGCFYNCLKLTKVPLLSKLKKVDIFGGNGGNGGHGDPSDTGAGGSGGAGSSWLFGTAIKNLNDLNFKNLILQHSAIGASGSNGVLKGSSSGGGGGGGGYYGGGGGAAGWNTAGAAGGGGGGSGSGGGGGDAANSISASGYGKGGNGGSGGAGTDGDPGGGKPGGTGGKAYDPNPSTQVDYSSQCGVFEGCTELTSVPQNLLADIDIESLPNTFKGCTELQYADVRLNCERLMSVHGFSDGTPTKTIVRVKTGSNTATSFNSQSTNTTVILEA